MAHYMRTLVLIYIIKISVLRWCFDTPMVQTKQTSIQCEIRARNAASSMCTAGRGPRVDCSVLLGERCQGGNSCVPETRHTHSHHNPSSDDLGLSRRDARA